MLIARKSPRTGITVTRDMPITEEQYNSWQNGSLIQNVMPHLSADDREWLISGFTPEDWQYLFGDEEQEELWCEYCNGTGEGKTDNSICMACKGTGV